MKKHILFIYDFCGGYEFYDEDEKPEYVKSKAVEIPNEKLEQYKKALEEYERICDEIHEYYIEGLE